MTGKGKGAPKAVAKASEESASAAITAEVLESGKFGGWKGGDEKGAKGAGQGSASSAGAGLGKGTVVQDAAVTAGAAPGIEPEAAEQTEGQAHVPGAGRAPTPGGGTADGAGEGGPNPLDGEPVHLEEEEEREDNEPLAHDERGEWSW